MFQTVPHPGRHSHSSCGPGAHAHPEELRGLGLATRLHSAGYATETAADVAEVRAVTDVPVAVGFGIRTPGAARGVASFADGVVELCRAIAMVR